MNFKKFSFYTLTGDLVYDAILIYIGIILGSDWKIILGYFNEFSYVGVVAFVIAIIYVFMKLKRKNVQKGQTNK